MILFNDFTLRKTIMPLVWKGLIGVKTEEKIYEKCEKTNCWIENCVEKKVSPFEIEALKTNGDLLLNI